MKKFKVFMAVILALVLSFVGVVAGCSSNKFAAPSVINIDIDYNMTWNEVEGARTYKVEIFSIDTGESTESSTRRTEMDLSELAEGDYEIRIMSIGGSQSSAVLSAWSETVYFHKNYESGMIYDLVGEEYHIKRAGTAKGNIVIEDEYRGKPVTAIDGAAFRANSSVISVVVGNNVVSIGENAFYNCTKMESVTLPDSLKSIGRAAFQGCRELKALSLPDGIVEIQANTFSYCRALTELKLSSNLQYIGQSAFYECSALTSLELPDSVRDIDLSAFSMNVALESVSFGKGIESIGASAFSRDEALKEVKFAELDGELSIASYVFSGCKQITHLELPEGTVSLGNNAFGSITNLESVSIPESLTFMGRAVAVGTKLHTTQMEESGFVYVGNWLSYTSLEVRNTIEKIDETTLREGTRGIANGAFNYADELQRVELPASVKYLGEEVFAYSPKLYLFRSPENGLISIGYCAFIGCAQLSRVLLNNGLETIDNYAFYQCSVLNTSEFDYDGTLIPASVTRVGRGAFAETLLWTYPDEYGVVYVNNWVVGFNENILRGTVVLKDDVYAIADYAFYKAENLQNIEGVNRVEKLGRAAFYLCTRLGTVRLNQNLEVIQPLTFYKCSSLYDIGELPWSLKEIGDLAFYVCETLKSFDLYDTQVKRVGSYAFYGCTNLKDLTLNEDIEVLDAYSFYNTGVQILEIPDSVKTIGERAFGKSYVRQVNLGNGVEEIGMFAFRECNFLTQIVIPDSVKKIDDYAFYGCRNLRSITLGNNVEYIGKYAFANARDLQRLEIPASVNYIGPSAFRGCGLKTIVMYGSIDYIGQYAFYGSPMTVYTASGVSNAWDEAWNEQARPVVQNCVFDEEEGYVVSVTFEKGTVVNGYVWGGIGAPYREGYDFVGWSRIKDAPFAEYSMSDLVRIPAGTTLYTVWQLAAEPEEPEDPEGPEEPKEPGGNDNDDRWGSLIG